MQMSTKWIMAAIALCVSASLGNAQAQNYPARAITLVIPFAPGGSTSIVGRGIADKMSELLGEKVVVDNRPGAGGTVGTKAVAKSDPDGYTLLLGYTGTLAIGPSLYKNVGYDPRKDFAPIGLIGNAPNSLVVNPSFPAKTVAELVAYAKANPGKVNFGSAGAGTASHITGEYFARSAGITLVHIPYKGTGPALTDLLGGHIPMAFAPIPASHPNVTAGKLRALAVTSTTRSGLLPDVPTMVEAGLPGFDASLYYGLAAPAGTPRPIIDKLNKALRDALASDEVKKQLGNDGTEITPGTPEDYADFIDKDEKKWSGLVKISGVEQE
jgi:tripartite-type tricarboxylate transporter receptor subunit TctC